MVIEAQQIVGRRPEHPLSPERRSPRRKAIVTGGNRDVGAGITLALAKAGIDVVFSYHEKTKRADKVLKAAAELEGEVQGIALDMSTEQGREDFFNQSIGILGEDIDFLILSNSGPTDALNGETSDDLLTRYLPHMKPGSVVVRMQSIPGHYMPQLKDVFQLGRYQDVANSKYPDLQSLRARIAKDMEPRGIKFIEICPTLVEGTSNLIAAKHEDPQVFEKHDEISEMLGVPPWVTKEQVGEKIVELLLDPNIRTGHTEFFNGALDTQTELEHWYDTSEVYVGTLQITNGSNGDKYGIGRAIISLVQASRKGELPMVDEVLYASSPKVQTTAVFRVREEHARGHFKQVEGAKKLPRILPAHKQIRAAIEAIQAIDATGDMRLVGFDRAVFSKLVVADGETFLNITPTRRRNGSYDVEIFRSGDGQRVSAIEGLRVRHALEEEKGDLLEEQALAGAAQTAGVLGLDQLDGTVVPIIFEMGKTEFTARGIKPGKGIKYEATTSNAGKKITTSSVIISNRQGEVATVEGLKTLMVSSVRAASLIR